MKIFGLALGIGDVQRLAQSLIHGTLDEMRSIDGCRATVGRGAVKLFRSRSAVDVVDESDSMLLVSA